MDKNDLLIDQSEAPEMVSKKGFIPVFFGSWHETVICYYCGVENLDWRKLVTCKSCNGQLEDGYQLLGGLIGDSEAPMVYLMP